MYSNNSSCDKNIDCLFALVGMTTMFWVCKITSLLACSFRDKCENFPFPEDIRWDRGLKKNHLYPLVSRFDHRRRLRDVGVGQRGFVQECTQGIHTVPSKRDTLAHYCLSFSRRISRRFSIMIPDNFTFHYFCTFSCKISGFLDVFSHFFNICSNINYKE